MRWFSGKSQQTETTEVRRDVVIKAIQADMDFESAIDRGLEGADFAEVRKRHHEAMRGLTPAEMSRVTEARDRHGY